MSNVFIVNSTDVVAVDKDPRLAYSSMASASTITASHDTDSVGYLYDNMTTLKWRPANTTSSIQFDGTFTDADYVGIAGVNWQSAGASVIVKDASDNVLGNISGLRDNQPVLFVFTKATHTRILLEFSCSNTSLEVGEVYFGESMQFPRNVSIGYKPGRWSSNDIVSESRTEGNQFGGSIVRSRGTTENFTINHVPVEFMEDEYKSFQNDAKGIPVFFLWNKANSNHAVYGNWSATSPTFTTSILSSISLTINGVA